MINDIKYDDVIIMQKQYEYAGDSIIEKSFYDSPTVIFEGHLYKVVIMFHHPECDCFK